MSKRLTTVAFGAIVIPFVAGCATKGFVRKELATQRSQLDSSISTVNTQLTTQLATERTERLAADSALRADLVNLRRDLDSLRTEFNVKIQEVAGALKVFTPVQFAFDDATIRDEDKPMLDRFASVMQKHYGGSKLTVEGFADPAGSRAYNIALSRRRAEAVKQYLTQKGITGNLDAVGYGKARLVVPGAQKDDPGAQENRRVVFVIESRGAVPQQGVATNAMQP